MPRLSKPRTTTKLGQHYLKDWRKYRGLTQEQVGPNVDMDRSNLSKVERSEVPYDQKLLEKLADIYTCSVGELLMRDPRDESGSWALVEALERLGPERREMIARMIKALADEEQAA